MNNNEFDESKLSEEQKKGLEELKKLTKKELIKKIFERDKQRGVTDTAHRQYANSPEK